MNETSTEQVATNETRHAEIIREMESVQLAQEKITRIKEGLNKAIDAMNQNQSLLSRAAFFWNKLPLWQKIIVGIILIVPAFLIAVVTHIASLLTISLFFLITYTVSSILLDNHQGHTAKNTEEIKAGISGLVDCLSEIITTLETLSRQLAGEVKLFEEENKKLINSIEQLNENNNASIKKLGDEIDKLKKGADFLEGVVDRLSKATIVNEKQQKKFMNTINEFLKDDNNFLKIAERLGAAEKRIPELEDKLKITFEENQRLLSAYQKLLVQQKELVNQLAEQVKRQEAALKRQENQTPLQQGPSAQLLLASVLWHIKHTRTKQC